MADHDLIAALNHSLGVGASDTYEGPGDGPREPHASHTGDPCTACGVRGHWPAVEKACRGGEPPEGVPLSEAAVLGPILWARFVEWWEGREDLPTMGEWIWNFAEWRRLVERKEIE